MPEITNSQLIIDDGALPIEEPLPPVDPEIDPIEDKPEAEVVHNAYSDALSDLLKKQWDVINACDSIAATLSSEESIGFDKDAVLATLKTLSDTLTKSVGMTTEAIGIIDPEQSKLMKQGEEEAKAAAESSEDEPEEDEPIVEDASTVSAMLRSAGGDPENLFSDIQSSFERYWASETLYYIESTLDEFTEGDDNWDFLNAMDENDLADVCRQTADLVAHNDYLWGQINDALSDSLWMVVSDMNKEAESRYVQTTLGDDSQNDGEER